ncbi:MAG: SEC-C domain-containing protein [Chlamydiales bacterium]|nr:SEC-C domain-containing protein [Chlamydiales bacterium]
MKEVGRNDPCPCGSGKKYKKCCAQKSSMERRTFTQINTSEIQSKIGKIAGALSQINQEKASEEPKSLKEKMGKNENESKET